MKIKALRLRRICARITQEEVREKLNITKWTLYKIEGGHQKPSMAIMEKLAELYKCKVEDIVEDWNATKV